MRLAALSAGRHLIQLAAAALEVRAEDLTLADGLVRERGGNRSASLWELLPSGRFDIDVDVDALAPAALLDEHLAQRLRGQRAMRLACGEQLFIHDQCSIDLLHARVVRPPHASVRLLSVDTAQFHSAEDIVSGAETAVGDRAIVVPDGSFLAVVAADKYQVVRAAARLAAVARWDAGDGLADRDVFQRLRNDPALSLAVVDGTPVENPITDPRSAPDGVKVSAQAVYERGYQMHALSARLPQWREWVRACYRSGRTVRGSTLCAPAWRSYCSYQRRTCTCSTLWAQVVTATTVPMMPHWTLHWWRGCCPSERC